jgi:predicted NBD/HSP70 family sugar kinase
MITAVDIGASKTLVAQFDHLGKMLTSIKFATPENQDEFYQELCDTLKKLNDTRVISIGAPGMVDNLGVIRRCGILKWKDFDLKGRLGHDFNCKVLIENDAKLAGLGEANALSPVPELCLYITVSTGIGEGVIQNGKLVQALKYSEAGHMMFFEDEQWQTWQNIVSGSSIKRHFGKLAKDITNPEDWQWISEKLALGLLALVPTIQPDTVIFGGSVGRYFNKYGPILIEMLDKRLADYIKRPELTGAQHPDEAVIYGCYYHATHQQNS